MSRLSIFFLCLAVLLGAPVGSAGLAHAQFSVPAPVIPASPVPAATGLAAPGCWPRLLPHPGRSGAVWG